MSRKRYKVLVGQLKWKVAIVHNTIAPYRHPLFEKLSQNLDLIIYYCSVKHGLRNWTLWPRNYDYEYKVLPGILVGDFCANPSVVKEIAVNKPQVLVLGGYVDPTMWLAFALGKLLKISIIYWTEATKEPQSILGAMTRPLRILFTKKSDAIIVPGRLSKNYVTTLGVDIKRVFTAVNSIDNRLFIEISNKYRSRKEELKAQLGFKGKVVILYVGQLIKRKGLEHLLRAYAKLKQEHEEAALVLLGSGFLEHELRNLASSLRLQDFKIIHAGLSLEDLIKLYSAVDIFALPTLEDIWGFVINEALACGLPVVTTCASQAAQEMIHSGENGYIVKEADSEQLYNALKNLIQDSERREKMGEKSMEIVVREFDPSHAVNGFLSAVKYCIKGMQK